MRGIVSRIRSGSPNVAAVRGDIPGEASRSRGVRQGSCEGIPQTRALPLGRMQIAEAILSRVVPTIDVVEPPQLATAAVDFAYLSLAIALANFLAAVRSMIFVTKPSLS